MHHTLDQATGQREGEEGGTHEGLVSSFNIVHELLVGLADGREDVALLQRDSGTGCEHDGKDELTVQLPSVRPPTPRLSAVCRHRTTLPQIPWGRHALVERLSL